MPENLPPAAPPPGVPISPLDQQHEPKRGWVRWLVCGLASCGLLAVLSLGAVGYLGWTTWQKNQPYLSGYQGIAPASLPGVGPFSEVTRYPTIEQAAELAVGDLDDDGTTELIAVVGSQVIGYSNAGVAEYKFSHEFTVLPSGGAGNPFASIAAPIMTPSLEVASLGGTSALIMGGMADSTAYVYRSDGTLAWSSDVRGAPVECIKAADLDGGGDDEVLIGRGSQMGLACLDSTGADKWTYGTALDDGDGDGSPEIYLSPAGGMLEIVSANGAKLGSWSTWQFGADIVTDDLDGDGVDEFVLAGTDVGGASGSGLNVDLVGFDARGLENWRNTLGQGLPGLSGSADVTAADLDNSGTKAWVVAGTDGTVRVYDIDGLEIGRHGMGDSITALAVEPAEATGQLPTVWVSIGTEIIGLQWSQWVVDMGYGAGTP